MKSRIERLQLWLLEALARDRRVIYKRLSANDTGATGGHQVGTYVPNRIAVEVAPELAELVLNPRRILRLRLVSHGQVSRPSLIHYNNRVVAGGTRDESRLTGFGGRDSAMQDPESTGALLVVSFIEESREAEAWLATDPDEDELLESALGGPVEPGTVGYQMYSAAGRPEQLEVTPSVGVCIVTVDELPASWSKSFPSPAELAGEAARRVPSAGLTVDARIERRHACEYSLFKTIEEHFLLPAIGAGFPDVSSFLGLAQSTLQRRKARAGRSLEFHLAGIFSEEGVLFEAQQETESGHVPDFVFPSAARYRVAPKRAPDLDILAAKRTLRDRWRQVLREADKVPEKHLFTLDEGVSEAQYRDIRSAGIRLVAPAGRIPSYPRAVRADLVSLGTFVARRRSMQAPP